MVHRLAGVSAGQLDHAFARICIVRCFVLWKRKIGHRACDVHRRFAIAFLVAALVAVAGCANRSETSNPDFSGVTVGAIDWSTEDSEHVLQGIDEAQILYLDEFVVFWTDYPAATATSISYGSNGDHLGGGIQLINPEIGNIECRYEITTRSSGTVNVAGETYDLSVGGLFLISARQPPVTWDELVETELRTTSSLA